MVIARMEGVDDRDAAEALKGVRLYVSRAVLPEPDADVLASRRIGPDELWLINSTSGTTGRSKAVMQTHANYVLTGQAYPVWLECEPGTRFYCCMPLFHVNAQAYATMGTIGNEGTLILV